MRSWRDILHLCCRQRFRPHVGTQELSCVQVHLPAQDLPKLVVDGEERQSRHVVRIEFNQHVHVAVGPEVIAQDGAEQSESPNMVPATELANDTRGNCNPPSLHILNQGRPLQGSRGSLPTFRHDCTMTHSTEEDRHKNSAGEEER